MEEGEPPGQPELVARLRAADGDDDARTAADIIERQSAALANMRRQLAAAPLSAAGLSGCPRSWR